MTLSDLMTTLRALPENTSLVFEAPDGPVAPGYHLTEFRHAKMTGYACDRVKDDWDELFVQLMDGHGGAYMTTGKFLKIASATLQEMPDIAALDVQVEFGARNRSRALYHLGTPVVEDGQVTLVLHDSQVACKAMTSREGSGCYAQASCC